MKRKLTFTVYILIYLMLASCGGSNPDIDHMVVKSDSQGVLLDTKDSATLQTLQSIFYNKEEAPDAAPDFMYFIDITIGKDSSRWQYSLDGYIREYTESNSMIFQLKEVNKFNNTANIN